LRPNGIARLAVLFFNSILNVSGQSSGEQAFFSNAHAVKSRLMGIGKKQ
jgi:hypothetical protein